MQIEGIPFTQMPPTQILPNPLISLSYARTPGLYLLSKEELGLGIESFVDGTHPNDLGMVQYATAYEKIIRSIMERKTKFAPPQNR